MCTLWSKHGESGDGGREGGDEERSRDEGGAEAHGSREGGGNGA